MSVHSRDAISICQAMQLMGQYAQANHEVIHRRALKRLRGCAAALNASAQTDLVDIVGRFQPKVVKMAP